MMSTSYGGDIARFSALSPATDGLLLDKLTHQLAAVRHQNRQGSTRGTSTQHHGGAMRVVKPRSAHNSPGSSGPQGTRRAVRNDSQYRSSTYQPFDESMFPASQDLKRDARQSDRPFSWHPPSQFVLQPESQLLLPPQAQYPMSTSQYPPYSYAEADYLMSNRQLPPTPAVYSGYTSPTAAFSPLSLPTTGFEPQTLQYFPQASWATMPELSPPAPAPAPMVDGLDRRSTGTGSDEYIEAAPSSAADAWNTFVSRGFPSGTAPPTPEDFARAPQVEPRLQSDESIPYQPLEEDDDDENGEILYGMGLYDTPEKPVDAHIQYHRSAISSLLGSSFACPEPTGKGLKLEDAWEPPASDGEESEQGDDDDAEGDAQED